MTVLPVRSTEQCRYDVVALGEVMLRLDPGETRVRRARTFRVWEGGGEYNVARALRRTFGQRAAVVTALADNEIGRLVEDCVLAGGVDTGLIQWVPFDGVGRTARNGLNFTERGFGVRGPLGVYDRGHTAVSQLRPDDVDWDHLFGELGVRWLHTGGIFAALSDTTAETAIAAVTAARRHGTVVSYDLNYRPSMWRSNGGAARAAEVNRAVTQNVHVVIGVDSPAGAPIAADGAELTDRIQEMVQANPQVTVVATTHRGVHSATLNDWTAAAWSRETGIVRSTAHERLEILDRVGGGDAFASGLVYGLLVGESLPTALEYGVAHGALAMTTPGDASMANAQEVRALATGHGGRTER